jgi:hypothetical protein
MQTTETESPLSAAATICRRINTRLLSRSRVVCIGLGGIGLILARLLVAFCVGLRMAMPPDEEITIVLVDGDSFELGNRYRMDVPGFGNKAVTLGQELLERLECPGLNVRWAPEYLTAENAGRLIRDGDCVLLACDNHATRRLADLRCTADDIRDIVLISGGNDGVEDGPHGLRGTAGNVQVFWREAGHDRTAPLSRFHPEIAQPADRSPADLSCVEAAVAGAAQLIWVNAAVAHTMGGALLRLLMPPGGENPYDEVVLDVLDAAALPHWLTAPAPGTGP